MSRKSGVTITVIENGRVLPAWALRAGQRITQTEYDHDAQTVKVWVEPEAAAPPHPSEVKPYSQDIFIEENRGMNA